MRQDLTMDSSHALGFSACLSGALLSPAEPSKVSWRDTRHLESCIPSFTCLQQVATIYSGQIEAIGPTDGTGYFNGYYARKLAISGRLGGLLGGTAQATQGVPFIYHNWPYI
jgi:hypothetical protein